MIIWPTQDTTNRTTDVDQKIAFWLWELFSEASLEEFGMKNEFIHKVFTMAFKVLQTLNAMVTWGSPISKNTLLQKPLVTR